MMTLVQAAAVADTVSMRDAHGTSVIMAQFELFNDSVRSGPSTKRRIMSTAPGITMPVRGTLLETLSGLYWIVGGPSYDYWLGEVIRIKYPVLQASGGAAEIRGVDQVLSASGGVVDARVDISYIRRIVQSNSGYFEAGYVMFYPSYYTVTAGTIVKHDGIYYIARQDGRLDDVGVTAAELARISSPLRTMNFYGKTGRYSAATDSHTSSNVSSVTVLVFDHTLGFLWEHLGYPKLEPGDVTINFLKSAVPSVAVGDMFDNYRVLSVNDNTTFWSVHARVG